MNKPTKISALMFCGLALATAVYGQGEVLPIEPMPPTQSPTEQADAAQLEYLRRAAGLTALRGPGIVVTLRDRQNVRVKDASKPIAGLVHDYDLSLIVNQLRAVEAEAIAINGVRIGSQTAITVVGPSIYIGGQRIGNPFKIEAIGDASRMKNKLAASGIADSFKNGGPQMNVATSKDVRVSALKQMPKFRFGKAE